jgi:hypothetical protein
LADCADEGKVFDLQGVPVKICGVEIVQTDSGEWEVYVRGGVLGGDARAVGRNRLLPDREAATAVGKEMAEQLGVKLSVIE